MSAEQFRQVLEKIKHHTQQITLHVLGEPLAHPQLSELLNLAQSYQKSVYLVTNGTLASKHQDILNHSAIGELHVSLQSFADNFSGDPRSYLQKLKASLPAHKKVFLRLWDVTADGRNLHESLRAALAEVFQFAWQDVYFKLDRKKQHYLTPNLALYFDSRFTWPSTDGPVQFNAGTCRALAHHIAILVDGTVVPCCLDAKGAIPLGNIYREELPQILTKTRTCTMKKGFADGVLYEELCRRCDFAQRFPLKNGESHQTKTAITP